MTASSIATSDRRGGLVRRGFDILALALVALNAWWMFGDRATPTMKSIDLAIASGRLGQAEKGLRGRLWWSRDDGEARMELARLLLKRGENLEGARQLHEVPFWWPTRGEASFLESQAFKQAGRGRDAEAALKACVVDDPLHPLPPRMFHGAAKDLVAYYVLEGRLEEGREVLWRAFKEATPEERPGVLATRIRLELERIDHAEAVTRLRDYVRVDSDDLDARRALALEEHAIGDSSGADREIEICLRARPDDPLVWRARLEILQGRGDVEVMHEVVARLPSTTEGDAKVWYYRAIDTQRAGNLAGAVEAFRRAAKLAPTDPEILYKLGMAESAFGQVEAGRAHLDRSRQLRQAFGELRDEYQGFLEESRRIPRDAERYRSVIERLAATCRTFGWSREAEAWLAVVSAK